MLMSDFGCGYLLFGCFGRVFNVVGLLLLFGLGLKVLQFSCYCKGLIRFLCNFRRQSSKLRNGLRLKNGFDPKFFSSKCRLLNFLENSNPVMTCKFEENKSIGNSNADAKVKALLVEEYYDGDDEKEEERYDEDEEMDVMALRKLVMIERRRANAAYLELEKERMAAATAAEEAMAMILRIQNEKGLIEMEANQYRRVAEEKQLHDQAVIQSLQWIITTHEAERSSSEDQLKFCGRTLEQYMKGDDGDQYGVAESLNFFNSYIEDACDNGLISSWDMDLSHKQW
ncbi:unnamed protein product [Ilex paraguariensis]